MEKDYNKGFKDAIENCLDIINEELPSSFKVPIRRKVKALLVFVED